MPAIRVLCSAMLAMKLVSSDFYNGSTYVFDEIDAGISGQVAETVAEKFADIACVTKPR